ncbi:hypothetical protein O181_085369 [Austropuccinia psidii MF-1]|uniref:Uncharacterized protein n=1 Tax=Austropuccinia psidii MF-1 TaxID=1389203 RepID=A0A9Q3FUW7_9BASI|nr:hypothetical protein [Austropuccinia psidii MF-1]
MSWIWFAEAIVTNHPDSQPRCPRVSLASAQDRTCHLSTSLRGRCSNHYTAGKTMTLPMLRRADVSIELSTATTTRKPASILVTQDFSDWLKWFIPQVEDSIDEWKIKVQDEGLVMCDYQKSPSWKNLYPESHDSQSSSIQLSFSLFVDWFNPLTNKLAGKQILLGVMALNCLNIPPHIRWKRQNTFISSMIPAPNQPNMITINNVLSYFVDELLKLQLGISILTPKNPNGQNGIVKLGCLIGDLVATHKLAGYASHSANYYCSWCEGHKSDISKLEIGHLRQPRIVKDYSYAFKEAKNKTEQDNIWKRKGIRWSELNRIPYWDPVNQVSLGIMHMWYEGVLQNHFVNRWRWSFSEATSKDRVDNSNSNNQYLAQHPNFENNEPLEKIAGLSFEQVTRLKAGFEEVVVPTGVTRVPHQIISYKGGKIKVSEWHSLFSIYLPLVCLNAFLDDFENFASNLLSNRLLLKNTCALITCTNILASKSIEKDDGHRFLQHYKTYCQTSNNLFENCNIVPNHHYALHVKNQLSYWGPLNGVSENSGERLNGFLQTFGNNGKPEEFGLEIITKFCQWQRLMENKIIPTNSKTPHDADVDFELDSSTYLRILSILKIKDPKI